ALSHLPAANIQSRASSSQDLPQTLPFVEPTAAPGTGEGGVPAIGAQASWAPLGDGGESVMSTMRYNSTTNTWQMVPMVWTATADGFPVPGSNADEPRANSYVQNSYVARGVDSWR
ncbi:unnamed protein product, partial [Amoebophrya sp. A25]